MSMLGKNDTKPVHMWNFTCLVVLIAEFIKNGHHYCYTYPCTNPLMEYGWVVMY